ncbi:MAG: hypothetical protein WDZ59_09065 [Pirellulales bacterium]
MDPFRICLAIGPLSVYCLLLGLMNLSRRPFLTTGARDTAALGVALAGLAVVGPLELFMPEAATAQFGQPFVWLLLVSFYVLCVTCLVMLSRPRLVIYNTSLDELRPVLAEVVAAVDPDARWAGESLYLPRLGVQLHLDSFPVMRNVSLIASGDRQDLAGWRQLEISLASALSESRAVGGTRGVGMITLAVVLMAASMYYMLTYPAELAQGMQDMLWR